MVRRWTIAFIWLAGMAGAEVPRVVTDIAPVQSIVARVMAGVGAPEVLVEPGVSPHDYAMRPSQARSLARADLVVWVGPALAGWLADPLETLAPDAQHITLMDIEGTRLLPARSAQGHVGEDPGEGHGTADDEAHAEHDEHGDHDDHAGHDAHDHAGGMDPHIWLDPANAIIWTRSLAETLAALDPARAGTYRANAAAAVMELTALDRDLEARLSGLSEAPFLVLHDAFQYFEARYGLRRWAAVSDSEATAPGPAHLSELRAELAAAGVRCAFGEPQTPRALLETVTEGHALRFAEISTMGAETGELAGRYPDLLRAMAEAMAVCLRGE